AELRRRARALPDAPLRSLLYRRNLRTTTLDVRSDPQVAAEARALDLGDSRGVMARGARVVALPRGLYRSRARAAARVGGFVSIGEERGGRGRLRGHTVDASGDRDPGLRVDPEFRRTLLRR